MCFGYYTALSDTTVPGYNSTQFIMDKRTKFMDAKQALDVLNARRNGELNSGGISGLSNVLWVGSASDSGPELERKVRLSDSPLQDTSTTALVERKHAETLHLHLFSLVNQSSFFFRPISRIWLL